MYTLWCICLAAHIDRLMKVAREHRLDPIRMETARTPDWVSPYGEVLVSLRRHGIGSGNWGYKESEGSLEQIRTRLQKLHPSWGNSKLDRAAHEKQQRHQKKQTPLPFLPGYYPELEKSRQFLLTICADSQVTLIMEYLDERWQDATQLPHHNWKAPDEVTLEALYYLTHHEFVTIGS